MLVLAAGAIAGGCSRDGPLVAPQAEAANAIVTPAAPLAISAGDASADALDDALSRLLPALGDHGTVLRNTLLRLTGNRSDKTARDDVRRVLDLLTTTLPAPYSADLDALRLELGVATN
jgi:hypothetical protein